MNANADREARSRALDPKRSFIVEAPAGSGKTELLTQRLLCLLDRVERPEQIIAITFTRKAAAEMRQRVVESLQAAAAATTPLPPHRERSVALARAVLARSEAQGWSLLEQSQRLRILTIDALNASLARQLPLLAGGIVDTGVSDNAASCYRVAAQRTAANLAQTDALGEALRILLALADNSLSRLEDWLAAALPQRDRWIPPLEAAAGEGLAAGIEFALGQLRSVCLAALRQRAGGSAERELIRILEGLAPDGQTGLATAQATEPWQAAARLLLTQAGAWRTRFTRREGVEPGDKAMRAAIADLLAGFEATPGLREALRAFGRLPATPLADSERQSLSALEPVLRRLLAELRVVFAESATVDHTEIALAAQQALGAADDPSELLLALDRRIEHILVDEFQDTSHLQWGLLERLTAGWEPDDGRTLFLVGDPMQSIYRFRDADLSLFLRAAREGIGTIALTPIRLGVNYRSAGEVVDWVNRVFPSVFASSSDEDPIAPRFAPAISGRGATAGAGVSVDIMATRNHAAEIGQVVALIRTAIAADPAQSIGILVRSRRHLIGLRALLAAEDIAAHAVEIDSLADTSIGLDLLALTQALLHDGDRLAWLAVLRSPVVGLGWKDLHALVDGAPEHTVPELLRDPARRAQLSPDGRERVCWLCERLDRALPMRSALTLGTWIRACWLLIDGPAALADVAELGQAERFFREIEAEASGADIDDPARLGAVFARPASAEIPAASGVELMTIHRAKGLEFDTVILPGLGRTARGSERKLLTLHDFYGADNQRIGLLAGPGGPGAGLECWLRDEARALDAAERARLLYVAATRARFRLHLIGAVGEDAAAPPRAGSLLATLWPGLGDAPNAAEARLLEASGAAADSPAGAAPSTADELITLPLERLRFDPVVPLPPAMLPPRPDDGSDRPEFEWVQPAAVQIGTLIHRELQRLADRPVAASGGFGSDAGSPLAPMPDRVVRRSRYRRELALLGVEDVDLDAAADRVAEAVEQTLQDPVGIWILRRRPESWSELRLSVRGARRIEHLQIDRSFVDEDGVRWIVDYKTGRHLGADMEAFLDAEVDRYRPQLERYAEVVAAIDSRPIRVGLYFPLLGRLRDWVPDCAGTREGRA